MTTPSPPVEDPSAMGSAPGRPSPRRRRFASGRLLIAAAAVVAFGVTGMFVAVDTQAGERQHGWWSKKGPPGNAVQPAPSSPPSTDTATNAGPAPAGPGAQATPGSVTPPPANAGFDYQLGEPYQPPAGIGVVSRDRGASPAAGLYNICYVNGFQTQPDEVAWWQRNHADLLLTRNGRPVVDEDWNEALLDVSTADKRTRLAGIVGGWIDECAAKGFDAIEVDNLDSWTRSRRALTPAHAVEFAKLLAARAHAKGLAIAQKNAAELSRTGRTQIGFDFAIAEECAAWDECDAYTDHYGANVLAIEYDRSSFTEACEGHGDRLSIVLRDVDVTAPGSRSYVFGSC